MGDFTESEKRLAEKSYYPDGTFAYSMIGPSIISFPIPVQFDHIFLKQHRAPNFYLKKSYGQHVVHGYLGEKLVLSSTVVLFSNMWKQFIPSENGVIIDRLVIPSMIDFDSLLVHIDNLQSYHIAEQSKKSHQAMFFEKIFFTNKDMQSDPTTGAHPGKSTSEQDMYHLYVQTPTEKRQQLLQQSSHKINPKRAYDGSIED